MIHAATIDIIFLLRQLVKILQPFANLHGIRIHFTSKGKILLLDIRPNVVIQDITNIICNVISFTPPGNAITLSACMEKDQFKVHIKNTGINLSLVSEIIRDCKQPLIVRGSSELKQTIFEWSLPDSFKVEGLKDDMRDVGSGITKIIPPYYDEIRKRLRSHFSKADNLVAQLSILYPRDAAFLQKVNAVIVANIENELFDAAALGREMNMSRASLFRRLKPLIQQAPATYIKSIRLQKAKELLETTDISVGDAGFRTGFQTQSHFSKAFVEMFGFLPSAIGKKKPN